MYWDNFYFIVMVYTAGYVCLNFLIWIFTWEGIFIYENFTSTHITYLLNLYFTFMCVCARVKVRICVVCSFENALLQYSVGATGEHFGVGSLFTCSHSFQGSSLNPQDCIDFFYALTHLTNPNTLNMCVDVCVHTCVKCVKLFSFI